MYSLFKQYIPDVKIYSAINFFGNASTDGSPYGVPFKELRTPYINKAFDLSLLPDLENIASHGLWHLDHKHVHADLQEHSIVSSCRLLGTDLFVPPFWRWSDITKKICGDHGITLWTQGDWINLDHNDFVEGHTRYLLHSWTMTPEQLEAKLKKHFK